MTRLHFDVLELLAKGSSPAHIVQGTALEGWQVANAITDLQRLGYLERGTRDLTEGGWHTLEVWGVA